MNYTYSNRNSTKINLYNFTNQNHFIPTNSQETIEAYIQSKLRLSIPIWILNKQFIQLKQFLWPKYESIQPNLQSIKHKRDEIHCIMYLLYNKWWNQLTCSWIVVANKTILEEKWVAGGDFGSEVLNSVVEESIAGIKL